MGKKKIKRGFPVLVGLPVFDRRKGRMVEKKRLGGLLKSYHRLAS